MRMQLWALLCCVYVLVVIPGHVLLYMAHQLYTTCVVALCRPNLCRSQLRRYATCCSSTVELHLVLRVPVVHDYMHSAASKLSTANSVVAICMFMANSVIVCCADAAAACRQSAGIVHYQCTSSIQA
jgi:hypothetical protein